LCSGVCPEKRSGIITLFFGPFCHYSSALLTHPSGHGDRDHTRRVQGSGWGLTLSVGGVWERCAVPRIQCPTRASILWDGRESIVFGERSHCDGRESIVFGRRARTLARRTILWLGNHDFRLMRGRAGERQRTEEEERSVSVSVTLRRFSGGGVSGERQAQLPRGETFWGSATTPAWGAGVQWLQAVAAGRKQRQASCC